MLFLLPYSSILSLILGIFLGGYLLMISLKIINPSKKEWNNPKMIDWYEKYGLLLKRIGIVILIITILNFIYEIF